MSEPLTVRDRILLHARDRFRVEGFARVTVDDLVSSLAMSKKTFYTVFESKDDLVHQIMQRRMGEIGVNIDRILNSPQNSVIKLNELMEFLGALISRIGFPFMVDVQRYLPELWKKIEDFRARKVADTFGKLVDQGMREGLIRADLNKRVFITAYYASIQQIMQPAILANESFSAHEALKEIVAIFFQGAMTERGRRDLTNLQNMHSSS